MKTEVPQKRGPKPWIPTEKEIEIISTLVGQGMKLEDVAHYFGVGREALAARRKEMPEVDEAIKKGKAKAFAFATGKLFELIRARNPTAIIFYLKTQWGWHDKEEQKQEPDITPFLGALRLKAKEIWNKDKNDDTAR